MREWKELELGEVCDLLDCLHNTPKYSEVGYSMVRVTDVKNGYLDTSDCLQVNEEIFSAFSKGYKPKVGDIVFTRVGSFGLSAIVKKEEEFCIGQNTTLLISKTIDPFFIFYYLIGQDARFQIEGLAGGSTQPTISMANIRKIVVPYPSPNEQFAIAEVLSSLDNKIDLLQRQNQTLEQMAETLFRQWFVEEADEGWEKGFLGELVDVKYGKDHKNLFDGIIPVYGSGGFMRAIESPLYEGESVLIPRKGTLNNVMYVNEAFWTVDTMFYTIMKGEHLAKFVYQFIKQKDLASMNVGSAVPSMTTSILNNMPIEIPPDDLLEKFDSVVSEFYRKIKSNQTQIRTLTALRDTLLPKLMSGEIRIDTDE